MTPWQAPGTARKWRAFTWADFFRTGARDLARTPVSFRLNGSEVAAFADGGANLLDLLRRGIGDLSPKYGCGQGTCGTCTVLIDGKPHLACLTLAESVTGRNVETTARTGQRAGTPSLAARVHGTLRGAMRLLHSGNAHGGEGTA